ncbi:hypothetical protein ACN4EE_08285 [Geminocystis sp. CENA526]|uniref:hypothetical protein n=1 Tax=Geminocystis sp. CENA526 TaxID=1355871 RepID=UPI003D6FF650
MNNKVILELPSELISNLTHQAWEKQTTLEQMIVDFLWQLKENQNREEIDPITPLLGTLRGEMDDIGENHDLYLGANLAQQKED